MKQHRFFAVEWFAPLPRKSSAHVFGGLSAGIGLSSQTRSSHSRQSVRRPRSVVSSEGSILCRSAAKVSSSGPVNGARSVRRAARRPFRSSSRNAWPRSLRCSATARLSRPSTLDEAACDQPIDEAHGSRVRQAENASQPLVGRAGAVPGHRPDHHRTRGPNRREPRIPPSGFRSDRFRHARRQGRAPTPACGATGWR